MNKTYAFSDLHGRYDLWQKIKDYTDNMDTLIFCGDAIDRGPDGIRIMLDLLERDNIIYLKGNHEDMMERAMNKELANNTMDLGFMWNEDLHLWIGNGGNKTYNYLTENFDRLQQQDILWELSKLPILYEYKNMILNHSGFYLPHINLTYKSELLWDREQIFEEWTRDENMPLIIHGHTPVQYITKDDDYKEILKYNNKIDIDLGAYYSNRTCLLDLDTLEPIYFEI